MGGLLKHIVILILALLWGIRTFAQEVTQARLENAEPESKRFSIAASLRESSNLISHNSPGHERQTELSLGVSLKLGAWGLLSLSQGITKAHQQDEELDVTNTKLGLKHTRVELHRDVGVQNGIYARLPANRKTREKDKLQTALGLENTIDLRLGQGPILITNRLTLHKNFHTYVINAYGTPTIEWNLIEDLTTTAELSRVVSLSLGLSYVTSRTYREVTKNRLDLSEELGFQISPVAALSMGHSNGEDLVRSTQHSSNIETFDDATSTIYGTFSLTY